VGSDGGKLPAFPEAAAAVSKITANARLMTFFALINFILFIMAQD
jgi:hypothetical protein